MSNSWSKSFGKLIYKMRTKQDLPLRKVAAVLDIDTSTLSKIEKGDRQANLDMIPVVAKLFNLNSKDLQVQLLSDKLIDEYGSEDFFTDALQTTLKKAKNTALKNGS